MPAKERLTKKEIEIDIRNNLKAPKEVTEAEWKKTEAIGWALCALIVILFFVDYRVALWAFFLIASLELLLLAVRFCVQRRKSHTARIEDYEIVKKPLSHIRLEKYERRERRSKSTVMRTIEIRFLCFEGYPDYQLPKENYRWSREYVLSNFFIYENAHRGEEFILAVRRSTGEIAVAYDADQFEYKE